MKNARKLLAAVAFCVVARPAMPVFAQGQQTIQLPAMPSLSPADVERELVTFAAQVNASRPAYGDKVFVKAEATGLQFLLHLRNTAGSKVLPAKEVAAQTISSQCRSPAIRGFTDQYGITMVVQIDGVDGSNLHRITLDRAICTAAVGPSTATPSSPALSEAGVSKAGISAAQVAKAGACRGYLGQIVTPQAFDSVIGRFSGITPKSEYETTAKYEARRAAQLGGISGPVIIEKKPEGLEHFAYDADRQQLRVSSYAFDNTNFPAWEAFYAAGYYGKIDVSTGENVDVVISDVDKVTGSYRASNGFGATGNVISVTRTVKAIFDHAPKMGGGRGDALFPGTVTSSYQSLPLDTLPMTPGEAQALKPGLRTAFVMLPRAPFVVKGTTKTGKTTLQNPRDVTLDFTILTADIQCGLLMDRAGRVLGAYPTS